jgi:hypothetical protein
VVEEKNKIIYNMKPHKFKGVPVYNPYKPRDLRHGGYVYSRGNMTQEQLNNDSVIAILRPNEIVVPVSHKGRPTAKIVKEYLLSKKIYLPYLKK